MRLGEDVGEVLALFVEHVREVHGEARLCEAEDEAVREVSTVHPVEGRRAVVPLLGERQPVATVELVSRSPGVVGSDLETGGVDQTVDLELLLEQVAVGVALVDDDARRCDALDAATLGVDEMHVRAVERVEVLVVETRPLAELAVVRLERLRRRRVGDDRFHSGTDLLHLLEVGEFHGGHEALWCEVALPSLHPDEQVADDVGPAVVDEVFRLGDSRDQVVEVLHPPFLPARLQTSGPLGVGGPVVADVDRRRRALEHEQFLRRCSEVGHALHRGGTGADDADALVGQAHETAVRIAARVVVVPPTRVEAVALERLDPFDAGQLRAMQRTARHDDVPGLHRIAAIRRHDPAAGGVVPAHLGHLGLEAGVSIEIEVAADRLAVREYLGGLGVLLLRHVSDLLEQRQIDVRLDITCSAGIAVPVPGAAEVAAFLDHTDAVDTGFAQASAGEEPAESAADDQHLDFIGQRFAFDRRDVGIVQVPLELTDDLDVLVVARVTQPFVAFLAVLLA